jgi:hypothetical protein
MTKAVMMAPFFAQGAQRKTGLDGGVQRVDLAEFALDLLVGDDRFAAHRQHAHDFLAVAGDANFFALFDEVDQGREVVLGFSDADGLHLGQKN